MWRSWGCACSAALLCLVSLWLPGDVSFGVGQAAPLPSSRVRVMGRVSGEWSEGRVVVLTVELRGTGIVQRIGDVAANPSSGLPRGPPQFRALLGRHRVNGELREGCRCLPVSWGGWALSEPLVTWWPIHHPGFHGSPPPVPGFARPFSVIVRWGAVSVVRPSVWWGAIRGGWWLWSESW